MGEEGGRGPSLPERIWRTMSEQAPDAMFITDTSFVMQWVNHLACELFARSHDEMIGHVVSEFMWDPTELRAEPLRRTQLLAGENTVSQRAFRTGRGERLVLELNTRQISEGLFFAVARDATLRLAAQERLARSEASFRALIERSPDGTFVHSKGIVLYVNSAAVQMLGYESPKDMIGRPILDFVHPDTRDTVRERISKLQVPEQTVPFSEERLLRRDGSAVIASVGAVSVVFEGHESIAAIARDVTTQRLLEGQLARTERMVSLGMLSAGVAHEINNPLAYLMLRLNAIQSTGARVRSEMQRMRERLEERLGPEEASRYVRGDVAPEVFDELADHVYTALEGADRVRSIVNDLRVFSRQDDTARTEVDIREPLERALGLGGHELRSRARVVTEYGKVPPVLASEGRLTQVFLNLLLNAAQAIPDGEPERNEVRISTRAEGDQVCIAITDTGAGIEPAEIPRLFEPFFTTKTTGVGTGLGLSICHGIVTALGGSIRVESQVGRGTTFTVILPRAPIED